MSFFQSFFRSFNFCFAFLLSIPLLVRNFCSYILTTILSISAKKHHSSVITSNQVTAPSMDATSNHLTTPTCSSFILATSNLSTSSSSPPSRWDVFLSFYGKDTRASFVAHLYEALDQAGIQTFRDDPALEKGDEISPALFQAIRSSNMFVVVLSENYAYSPWSLDELVEILFCKRTNNQVVVIPVFYYVNPTDVRYHKETFAKAIDYHYQKKRYSDDMIDKWKSALAEIGDLSGYHLKKDANENEAHTIQKIVEDVALPKILHLEEYVFGIDSVVEAIHLKLKMESNDVRAIVILGMGGIGKTTTAKAFFNKYSSKFGISCFIENAKQYSLLSLIEQLLIELLRKKDYKVPNLDSGIKELQQILPKKRALIILDDLEQLELLVKLRNMLSPGSRIIITTRNARLQNKLKVDISEVDVYEVKGLGESESLELFSYHAFKNTVPPECFKELSEGFISYAGGLPLALKVFGSSLHSRTEVSFWEAQLEIVRKFPQNEIQSVLQVGYDGLDNQAQKDIFLDIAFFFVGRDKDETVHIFNSCGFLPDAGIPILVERCLLTIDEDNKFQMHNLIQDMGMELGKSRGLFWRVNNWEDLQYSEDTYKIEGLIIDLTISTERQMSAKIFERLPKLRLLQIFGARDMEGNFKNLFPELRCIRWPHCPWTRLPYDFYPRKLVSIDMSSSKFKILWKDVMPLVSLKTIDLSYSWNLKTTPDFTDSKTVEKLLLGGCENLVEVHPSIGQLTNLGHLDLRGCINVELLPNSIQQLTKLGRLDLFMCYRVKRLPEQLGDMKGLKMLDASYTAIEQLPDSIAELKELVDLRLFGCTKLNKLPEKLGDMEGLRNLDASCTPIEQLPDSIGRLINLVELKLGWCGNLTSLPNSICKLKLLRVLHLGLCSKLERLPEELGKMQSLEKLDASDTAIEEIPDSIGLLSSLQYLNLNFCWELKKLPEQLGMMQGLKELLLSEASIEELPDSIVLLSSLQYLSLGRCRKLKKLPEQLGKMHCLEVLNLDVTAIEKLPDSIGLLSSLQYLSLDDCSKLEYLPNSLRNLRSFQHFDIGNAKFKEI